MKEVLREMANIAIKLEQMDCRIEADAIDDIAISVAMRNYNRCINGHDATDDLNDSMIIDKTNV